MNKGGSSGHMAAVACVYLGLVTALMGVVALVRPMPPLCLTSSHHGALLLLASLLLSAVGWALPARERRVAVPRTRLERFSIQFEAA